MTTDVSSAARKPEQGSERRLRPPVDIYETADGLTILVDLPGVARDALTIEVSDHVLTIEGEPKHALEGSPRYREFALVGFHREIPLPETVDSEHIQAEFKHGVLTLQCPKAEQLKPRQIKVELG